MLLYLSICKVPLLGWTVQKWCQCTLPKAPWEEIGFEIMDQTDRQLLTVEMIAVIPSTDKKR